MYKNPIFGHIFNIEGSPTSYKNNRMIVNRGSRPMLIKPRKIRECQESFSQQLRTQSPSRQCIPKDIPLTLIMKVTLGTRRKKDLSGIVELIGDCLETACIIEDDNAICRIVAEKVYEKNVHTIMVRIEEGKLEL